MPARLPETGQSMYLRDGDCRCVEGDVTSPVALVGKAFSDADDEKWAYVTGYRLLANRVTLPNSRTISARASGIKVVPAPHPSEAMGQ